VNEVEAMSSPRGRVLSLVNKKEVFEEYMRLLESRMKDVQSSIATNRMLAIDAPSAMQSHSDTSKAQHSWIVNSMLERLKLLNETIDLIRKINLEKTELIRAGAITLIEYPDYSKKVFALVCGSEPGDLELNGLKFNFISLKAPLAKEMLGKRIDDSFIFRGDGYEILEVI